MNKFSPLRGGIWIAVAAVAVVATGLTVRPYLSDWTQRQLRQQHGRRIQALPDEPAAALVRQLVHLDADAPAVLVPLVVEQRAAIADSAADAIDRLVADWSCLKREEATPRIATLASELATVAPKLPAERRRWAQALATRLLVWPTNDPVVSGQVIADCETVLRLPVPEETEVRLAAAERSLEADVLEVKAPAPLAHDLPGTLPAASSPEQDPAIPRVYGPVEPERLIDASKERPLRPKQFLPPRAMKIEG